VKIGKVLSVSFGTFVVVVHGVVVCLIGVVVVQSVVLSSVVWCFVTLVAISSVQVVLSPPPHHQVALTEVEASKRRMTGEARIVSLG
jgi:hypothetical protein